MLDDKNHAHPAWGAGLFLVLPAGLGEGLGHVLAPLWMEGRNSYLLPE